ncbi:MAG: OmpA family protein [Muribaculaceae bacterium]|nr:OmpA family protein [Muribaculaceae bacterium]
MKTRNLYYAMALIAGTGATAIPASAQDVFVDEATTVTEYTCDNSNHYYSNWRNNWFIEVDAGINQPFVERGESHGPVVDRKKMTLTYGFGVGRWISPYLGLRLKALGGAMHWDTPLEQAPTMGWTRAQHVNLQAELMWDMFNSMGGVNDNRVFSIIPFVGLGGDVMWNYRNANGDIPAATNVEARHGGPKRVVWTLPVSAGLQFRLRLCEYVDFFAEARATFYGDNWNNYVSGNSVDANVAVLGGFNFNIGGRKFNKFNQCNYVSEIAALNGQVNDLRAQLLGAGAEIAALQSQLPCPEPQVVAQEVVYSAPLLSTVRFTINSDKITPEEQVNVYNMAEWLKANPNQKVVICGYADKDTGTSEYNMDLSQRRANAVADALVNTYGISRDRLSVKFDGSSVQPYGTNDWNRIVIFSQQ